MGGLFLKLQNFNKVKLIFGHPVCSQISVVHSLQYIECKMFYAEFLVSKCPGMS